MDYKTVFYLIIVFQFVYRRHSVILSSPPVNISERYSDRQAAKAKRREQTKEWVINWTSKQASKEAKQALAASRVWFSACPTVWEHI